MRLLVVLVVMLIIWTCQTKQAESPIKYTLQTLVSTGIDNAAGLHMYNNEIYFVNQYKHVVQKRSAAGVVSVVAGKLDLSGSTGDGSAATSAKLNLPYGVHVFNDKVYIADQYNCKIRLVSSGVITTLAGSGTCAYAEGAAAVAQFANPPSIFVVSDTLYYIADFYNHRIRKVESGMTSSIAGTTNSGYNGDGISATSAQLNEPHNVFVRNNKIYIVDKKNNRIRMINNVDGKIYTVAGNGTLGIGADGVLATSSSLNNPVSVSLFPAFQSILLSRALVSNRGALRNSSWDITLNSMVLNQGNSLFQPEFRFTISRNQSKDDNTTVYTGLEAFVHSGHYMYFFQKAKTATCLVTMERFVKNRQKMITVSIYGIIGTALSSTAHVYSDGPFLINNYTFIDDGSVDYATIKRSISMTAVQIDGTHQDLFVVSHNFETDTCMYHSISSATEMTSNNLPSDVSCYSVDTGNTQMIETLQDSVVAATESHIFILGTDGKLVALEAVPPCRKGYQIASNRQADLTIHIKSLYVSQFIYSCHNSNDRSVSLLHGKLFSTTTSTYFLRLGTEFTSILSGGVESSWLTSALRDFKYQDISKEASEVPIEEYHIFLTYERKDGNRNLLYTIKCTCPTISISTSVNVDNLFELDDYSPFCSIPFKHESINDKTISFGISTVKNFGILVTSFYYSSKSTLILSTELANWQGGYKWIGITVPSYEQTSSNVVSVAQRGLIDIPSFVKEYLIEGASYYANIDGTITRKKTPYYIGYAVNKKKLVMDSSFVQ